jgi:hypothetical protein
VVNIDGAIKNEATFQFYVALALSELCRPADIRLEVRADYTRGDVLLVRKDGVLVLELKYVPVESLTLGVSGRFQSLTTRSCCCCRRQPSRRTCGGQVGAGAQSGAHRARRTAAGGRARCGAALE